MAGLTSKSGADNFRVRRHGLRDLDMAMLRAFLAYQNSAGDGDTMGPGLCGHNARGSAVCADCINAEIDRRTPTDEVK